MDNTNFSPEQIQQMILLLQKMLPQTETVVEPKPKVSKPKVKKNSTSTKSKQNPIKTKKINMYKHIHL
jgi:hypothetical protein